MSSLLERVAGAPISWGVCEVPGWGHQLQPVRVLGEMAGLGLRATELGPDGFLPTDPAELTSLLGGLGLQLVGGFVPATLHVDQRRENELASVERQAQHLAAGGSRVLVLAAAAGGEDYETSPELTDEEWKRLIEGIDLVVGIGRHHGLEVSLHPHYGTVIESPESVDRLLVDSAVGLCLDTGHVMVGGGDPVALVEAAASRVRHVHLKDVKSRVAARVRAGELSYRDATAAGMYCPLGEGDVDLARFVEVLEVSGYQGWYVLEQDTVLSEEPAQGRGPLAAAAASLAFLRRLAGGLEQKT